MEELSLYEEKRDKMFKRFADRRVGIVGSQLVRGLNLDCHQGFRDYFFVCRQKVETISTGPRGRPTESRTQTSQLIEWILQKANTLFTIGSGGLIIFLGVVNLKEHSFEGASSC